jgi:hypothetical protein
MINNMVFMGQIKGFETSGLVGKKQTAAASRKGAWNELS